MALLERISHPLPPKRSRPLGLWSQFLQFCQNPWERQSAVRRRLNRERLDRLAEIETEPARSQGGRVITLVAALPGKTLDVAEYLRPWLSSAQRVGLRGTVLVAGNCELKQAQQLYPEVELRRIQLGTRHLFLERHFAVRDFLRQLEEELVAVTDGGDVAFRRDPFPILGRSQPLCLGSEAELIGQSHHTSKKLLQAYGDIPHRERRVLNPGIMAGKRTALLELLDLLTAEISRLQRPVDCDMGVYNKVVHDHFAPAEILTGEPLHSRFGAWEFDTTAAIIHK